MQRECTSAISSMTSWYMPLFWKAPLTFVGIGMNTQDPLQYENILHLEVLPKMCNLVKKLKQVCGMENNSLCGFYNTYILLNFLFCFIDQLSNIFFDFFLIEVKIYRQTFLFLWPSAEAAHYANYTLKFSFDKWL